MADENRARAIADDIERLERLEGTFADLVPRNMLDVVTLPSRLVNQYIAAPLAAGALTGFRREEINREVREITAPIRSIDGSRELNRPEIDAILRRQGQLDRLQIDAGERPISFVAGAIAEAGSSAFFSLAQAPLPTAVLAGLGGLIGGAVTRTPAGAAAGARTAGGIGYTGSIYLYNFEIMQGMAYAEYRTTRLNTGEMMDHETALGASTLTGLVNGALDAGADKFLVDRIAGIDRLFARPVRDTVDELLQTPQGRSILRTIGQSAAQAATVEGATEFLQTLVELGVGQGAVATAEGAPLIEAIPEGIGEAFSPEGLAAASAAGLQGAVGGAGLVVVTSPATASLEAYYQRREQRSQEQRARTAEGRIEIVENAIAAASETRLVDRDRGELAQFINEATAESPVSTIYVAPADLQSLAQERGVSYETLAQSIGASAEQIAQVDATPGTLIEIPIGDFIAAVAKTDLQQAAVEIIKTDPMLFTRREIGALREAGQEEAITVAERLAQDMAADIEGRTEVAALERDLEAELAPVQQAIEEGLAPLITDGAARQIGDKGVIPYARITAQSYAVIGQIEGITASKARQLYPLRFAAMERGGQGLGQPIEEGAPVEGGPAVRAGRREIPVLPEPNTPEWNALLQAVADKQARGERLTANERAIANLNREDAAELSRILQRIREGKELTPASQRFLRERGYDPVTGQPVEEGFGQSQKRSRLTPDEARLVQERADELANAAIAASKCSAKTAHITGGALTVMAVTGRSGSPAAAGLGEMIAGNLLGLGIGGAIATVPLVMRAQQENLKRMAEEARIEGQTEEARQRQMQLELQDFSAFVDGKITELNLPLWRDQVLQYGYTSLPEDADLGMMVQLFAGIESIDPAYLNSMISRESRGQRTAANPESTALGVAQFIEETWQNELRVNGARYGFTGDPKTDDASWLRTDPRLAIAMAATFTRDNAKTFQERTGREPTHRDAYGAHFFGIDAYLRALRLAAENYPNAARAFPAAAEANETIFFDTRRSGWRINRQGDRVPNYIRLRNRSVSEVLANLYRFKRPVSVWAQTEPAND
jgi:hypothetical protein